MNEVSQDTLIELSDLFLRIVNRYNEIEKTPYAYGIDMLLHLSEIYTIEAIGKNEGINITKLSKLQGITKGAVSKKVQQLVKKGLVIKKVSPKTDNEVILYLSEIGEKAFQEHNIFLHTLRKSLVKIYQDVPATIILDMKKIGLETEKLFIDIAEERKALSHEEL